MEKNGNHRLCLKSKPHVKCHWSLQAGLTSEGDARTYRFLDLDTAHKLPPPPPTPTVQEGPFPDQIGRIAPTETINNPLRTAKAARAASEVKVHVRVEDTVDPPPPPPPPQRLERAIHRPKRTPPGPQKPQKQPRKARRVGEPSTLNTVHKPPSLPPPQSGKGFPQTKKDS